MEKNALTIPELFFNTAKAGKEKSAFVFFRGSNIHKLTYGEVMDRVISVAMMLRLKGIKRSDAVAIYAGNSPEWCIAYLAVSYTGGICVPIDAELGSNEVRNLLNDSEAKAVFTGESTKDTVLSIFAKKDMIIPLDSPEFMAPTTSTKRDVTLDKTDYPDIDDIASIIYTSGTTGTPKGVVLTHRNFCSDAEALIKTKIINENDRVLSILPLHHTYAFMCTFITPLFLGAAIVYPKGLKGPELFSVIKEQGVTILIGVPRLLEMILTGMENKIDSKAAHVRTSVKALKKLNRFIRSNTGINGGKLFFSAIHKNFGSSFRFMTSGGAKLPSDIMQGLESYGFTVLEGYGLTETSPVVTFNPPDKRVPDSAGIPLDGVEIKTDAPEDSRVGEILIKGPMVMKGYYKMAEETEKVLKDGWFRTGDLGYLSEKGYLFITGRAKEVIVLSTGKNIYPQDVENNYLTIPLVKEICVFESTDKRSSLHGLVVPDMEYAKEQNIANIYEFIKWEINEASAKLPPYMRIKGFTLYAEPLPKTPLGKLKRFLIKDIVKELDKGKKGDAAVQGDYKDDIEKSVVESVRKILDNDQAIGINDNLELDLGIDSLKRVELMVELERKFSTQLSNDFALQVQTVGDIIEGIRGAENRGYREESNSLRGLDEILSKAPSSEDIDSTGLNNSKLNTIAAETGLVGLRVIFKTYFRGEVKGLENLPVPPFIICPNHSSYLDAFFLASMIPLSIRKELYFQGVKKFFTGPLLSDFAKTAQVIPIDPDAYLTKALSLSSYLLREGKSLCIFPEGGRTFDGNIAQFKKGIAILSLFCNAPIVPAHISGSYKSMPRGARMPKPVKLTLQIGKPINPDDSDNDVSDKYQNLADKVREAVIDLSRK